MQYVISMERHGFIVRDYNDSGIPSIFWAYSTLEEALDGLRELLTVKGGDKDNDQ